jgi:hypothetical protein
MSAMTLGRTIWMHPAVIGTDAGAPTFRTSGPPGT